MAMQREEVYYLDIKAAHTLMSPISQGLDHWSQWKAIGREISNN